MPAATATAFGSDLHDPTSTAYKKARRRHLKTTRNRGEVEADWTPFRTAEKKYKARFPPPDLSSVLDLALLDTSREEETRVGGWRGRVDAVECREICLEGAQRGRKAYIFPGTPGLVLLPSFVPHGEQRRLVRWALRDHARPPNETNLDTHYILPEEGLWNKYASIRQGLVEDELVPPRALEQAGLSAPDLPGPRRLASNEPASKENYAELSATAKPPTPPSTSVQPTPVSAVVPKLRWANIGWYYHWGTKQYDFTRGKVNVHDDVKQVCKEAVSAVDWRKVFGESAPDSGDWGEDGPDWMSWNETYEPNAGIVNYYQVKDTLMAHVDRSEVCATSPLVSISLGCAAVFLIGGLTREAEPTPILLRSGDIVIMSGPACRRAYHGVPRILEDTLPPHLEGNNPSSDWGLYEEYLRSTRINVNVRQVFPPGFDPLATAGG